MKRRNDSNPCARLGAWVFLIALLAVPTLILARPTPHQEPQTPVRGRIRIVPQTSDRLIQEIQESPDGTRMLTHDRGAAPRLWDPRSMKLLKVLEGTTLDVDWAEMSLDGSKVLCLSQLEIAIWDTKTARLITRIEMADGVLFTASCISPDGKSVAVGDYSGRVILKSLGDEKQVTPVQAPTGCPVKNLSFSSDGKRLAVSFDDLLKPKEPHLVRVYEGGKQLSELQGATLTVAWAKFSGDGSKVATTSVDNIARVYDAATGKMLYQKEHVIGDRSVPTTLMASIWVGEKHDEVLVATRKGDMEICDGATGAVKRALKGHTAPIREIRQTRDGLKVATYGDDNRLLIWDVVGAKSLDYKVPAGNPTAGEFSADGRYWLLGYQDGRITRQDLSKGSTGDSTWVGTTGSLQTLKSALPLDGAQTLWVLLGHAQIFYDPHHMNRGDDAFLQRNRAPQVASNGKIAWWFYYNRETSKPMAQLMDISKMRRLILFEDAEYATFTPDGTIGAFTIPGGGVNIVSTTDPATPVFEGKTGLGWTFKDKEATFSWDDIAMSSDNKTLAVLDKSTGEVNVFDYRTGKSVLFVETRKNPYQVEFSPDGKKLFLLYSGGLAIYDMASDDCVFDEKLPVEKPKDDIPPLTLEKAGLYVSPDGKRVWASAAKSVVWDAATGKRLIDTFSSNGSGYGQYPSALGGKELSPDGRWYLCTVGHTLYLYDVDAGMKVEPVHFQLNDTITQAAWFANGERFMTCDDTDGVTIWDATDKKKPKKLGSFVVMRDGSWLVWDTEGRYDAQDPTNVPGAVFVLEWEGGLEPISISQLKSQFYEPGLLAKIMGYDKEPVRDVPSLDTLRLYPSVSVKPSAANRNILDVNLEERDQGGLGRAKVYINGKEVYSKEAKGYFKFNLDDYQQYLLPQGMTPEGQGNVVSVTASNEKGDLWSLPISVDIGVPEGMRAPEVRLHALCVGVGDYAGSDGDLQAPARDAEALSKALEDTANRLLPNHVQVTTLTTSAAKPQDRPTRERVLKWFEDTAKQATSSDIVFVFFAGHGMSTVGARRGYFFLTPEADPGDMSESAISTSTISADILKEELSRIPANKQVVILDTCASGAAASSLIGSDRSLSGDYQRAWESIKDSTGVWMLAGSAADQKSYESVNVEHGMLTYALLEAIDRANGDGLRTAPSGEMFLDVEKWLGYAADRVESLKNEVGLGGLQKPEFKRSPTGKTFDLGVTNAERRGSVGLRPPKPVVIMGSIQTADREDPNNLEPELRASLRDSTYLKAWFDVAKHPKVYRVEAEYSVSGENLTMKVFLQAFDSNQARRTLETFELTGTATAQKDLCARLRKEIEDRIRRIENSKAG